MFATLASGCREVGIVKSAPLFQGRLLLGELNAKKWGDHLKKKLFIYNSLKFIKVQGDCDIISVRKVTQTGGQWKLYTLAPLTGLNYSLCGNDEYQGRIKQFHSPMFYRNSQNSVTV